VNVHVEFKCCVKFHSEMKGFVKFNSDMKGYDEIKIHKCWWERRMSRT
jgi:hypothetical protein